ncbi:hypothetical protein C1H46_017069 [Malus baccata]|uniref:DNA-(apurinic or apyrimidinic site) endonuclease 2 n=1 Tax=Malus baccata TaxID=106549 RepID=A0A540MF01_MALBA|nr:hypothetical protein C1H46_017069 [Malus baccata]
MKIVTYNVNGLRPRIAQFGSLFKLLNSLDADFICFQETKLRRQELTAELAEGYESFSSRTDTSGRGRTGYSDNCAATFCRAKWAFSSDKVALPEAVEECFTGVLDSGKGEMIAVAEGLEEFSKEELLKIYMDNGCVVLFNLYGPRAGCDDTERTEFKLSSFQDVRGGERTKTMCGSEARKKSKRSSQLSLRSFFQKSSISSNSVSINTYISTSQRNVPDSNHLSNETPIPESQSRSPKQYELNSSVSNQDQDEVDACSSDKENSNFALLEWQRLQQVMQNSIPVCKHHSEPCVARVVSKRVPNFGRRFYVCARAERNVPDSNHLSNETPIPESQSRSPKQYELNSSVSNQDQDEVDACSSDKENSNFALLEWQRLQQVMQNSIPVCKHHSEPCVARVVSKRVPNFGCRFYVCARAERAKQMIYELTSGIPFVLPTGTCI